MGGVLIHGLGVDLERVPRNQTYVAQVNVRLVVVVVGLAVVVPEAEIGVNGLQLWPLPHGI